jgi:superfamily II DNA/RNA helicase
MIEILAGGRARALMPRSLVLAPTRELAAQVAESFDRYSAAHRLTQALITGGSSMAEQMKALEAGVDVLIATPGRLLDLMERGRVRLILTDIKILVIDEADRMLDMGFVPDIEKIVTRLPAWPRRQTLLFSATMPPEIRRLTKQFQNDPKDVSVDPPASPAETVEQFLVAVGPRGKRAALLKILEREAVESAFIFCNRKRDIDPLAKALAAKGYDARPLHGDMDQSARTATLAAFKAGEIRLLVCSDVAGRGIDVSDVSHVVNYDLPFHAEDYVHRIGRTGRAGATGRAWSLAGPGDGDLLAAIEKLIGRAIPQAGEARAETPKPKDEEEAAGAQEAAPARKRRSRGGRGRGSAKAQDTAAPSEPPPPKRGRGSRSGKARAPQKDQPKGFGDDMPGFFAVRAPPPADQT